MTYQIYTVVNECEMELDRFILWGKSISNLQIQGFSEDFFTPLIAKMKQLWSGVEDPKFLHNLMEYFSTYVWVMKRLQRVTDWEDVLSILDYITRIHVGRPFVALIVETALQTLFGAEVQSTDWSILKDLVSGYNALKNHPVVVKFIKVVSLAFSGGILASMGIEAKCADIWKMITETMTKIVGHTDFIAATFDLFYFLGERISAFCLTGDWKCLLHTTTSYTQWVDDSYDILDKSIALSNPDAIDLDYHDYMNTLEKLIEQGGEIKKFVRAADEKDAVSQLLSRMRILYNDIVIKNACGKLRKAPFAMLVCSGTGVAKTTFTDTCFFHFAKIYNKPQGDDFIYTRTAAEPHYNNFKTYKWGCLLDDVAAVNPNTASADPSLSDTLQQVSNNSFSPPQAAIEDKGRTPFMCDIVIATTNQKDLKAHAWFNNPQAVRRRLPYVINLLPKEDLRLPGSLMIDKSKLEPPLPGHYPDYWLIEVEEVTIDPQEKVKLRTLFKTDSIYEFMSHYNTWLAKHDASQTAFMASREITREVKLCRDHLLPITVCKCDLLEIQAGEEIQSDGITLPSLAKTALGAGVMFATYRALGYTAGCAAQVIRESPTIINSPSRLFSQTADYIRNDIPYQINSRISNVKYSLCRFTRKEIKALLQKAFLHVLYNLKPLLCKMMVCTTVLIGAKYTWDSLRAEVPEVFPSLEKQTEVENFGIVPKSANESENVWRKDDYVPSEFLGRLSLSWSNMELSQAASLVGKNTVWCRTDHGNTKHTTFRALCVAGHLYVVPNHVLPHDEYFNMQVIHENNSEGCNGNIRFKVSQRMILRLPERELAFFEISHMPGRRNLVELFPKRGCKFDGPGRMIIRQPNGTLDVNDAQRVTSAYGNFVEQFNTTLDMCSSYITRDTMSGDCGSPTIVKLPNSYIMAGLHCLGGQERRSVSVIVPYEIVQMAIQHFGVPIVDVNTPKLDNQSFTTDISKRCSARFVDSGTVQVFGSFTGFKRQPKSTACNTLFTNALLARGWTQDFGPAPMKGYSAIHIALKSMVQKTMSFKVDVMRACVDSFAQEVWKDLPLNSREELAHPFSLSVALNGVPGLRFVDSMNFGTSTGYPYNTSKRDFITVVPANDIWQHPVVIDDIIKDEVEELLVNMQQGIISAVIFMQHLKDEALPLRKVKQGKARVFMGGPFAWSICVRMLLLPFIRVMQQNKYLFESAPGTNTTSIEWSRLYQYLSANGTNRAIAGDFKAFDKAMGSLVILEAFRFINTILRNAGCSVKHLTAVQTVAEDTAFAFCNYNGDLMRFFGSNPSGHPLTVIINCIVNSLYMRYCYHELKVEQEGGTRELIGGICESGLCKKFCISESMDRLQDFKENIRLMTYGDDNVMTSKVDWFNHTAVASVLSTVGIEYTMADKISETVPFVNLSQVSFLKRSFRWEPMLRAYMAVLEEDSIKKSLMILIPSKTESPQKQCIDIVASAVSEWFFYGKERFEKEVAFLKEIVSEVGLDCYTSDSTFPTWDTLVERFNTSSDIYLKEEPKSSQKILGIFDWDDFERSVTL